MTQPLAHLYDLALRSLDEQDRRADALRSRLGPVLAAAALGASLLSGPVIGGRHPATIVGRLALAVAVVGLVVMAVGVVRLLGVGRSVPYVDPHALATEFRRAGLLGDEASFYEMMIVRLRERLVHRERANKQLAASFTVMLWGILVMLCGLGLAAIIG